MVEFLMSSRRVRGAFWGLLMKWIGVVNVMLGTP
jgi:hypothetical protein